MKSMKRMNQLIVCVVATMALSYGHIKKVLEETSTDPLVLENIEALTAESESEGIWRGISNSVVCPGKTEVKEITVEITVSADLKSTLLKKGIPFTINADGTLTYKEVKRTEGPVYHVVCTDVIGVCWGTDC